MSPNPAQPVNAWGAANDQWRKQQQQGQQPAAGGAPAPAAASPAPAANPYAPQATSARTATPAPAQQQPAQQYQPPSRGYYGEPQAGAPVGGGIASPQPNQAKPMADSKSIHGQDQAMPMDSGMGTQIGGGIDGGNSGWGGGAQSFLAGGPGGTGSSYLEGDAPPMQIQQGDELAGSPMRRHGRRM